MIFKDVKKYIFSILKINSEMRLVKFIQVIITFILVDFAWIFFRSNTLNDSIYIIKNLFVLDMSVLYDKSLHNLGLDEKDLYLSILLILFLIIVQIKQKNTNIIDYLNLKPIYVRWFIYLIGIFSIIIFGYYGQGNESQFIYFQF
tara:strand:- start:2163 stop:2597 length:435 start_codon:yes stop_codon:yes gene_type:complete